MKKPPNRTDNRKRWAAIENGEIADDYTNHFLSHFGFWDDARRMEKTKESRDAYEAELLQQRINSNARNGFESQE